jgi:hypothetical protein
MDLKVKMKETIDRLAAAINAKARDQDFDHVKLRPYPPAPEMLLARYETHLQLKLPPSYRAFLELHNGYDFLAYPGHMLPIEKVMPGGEWYEEITTWKKLSADYGNGEVLNGIVIANFDDANKYVFLDPTKPTTPGEFTVVHYLPDSMSEYPDLFDFFEDRIRYCNIRLDFNGPWEYVDPRYRSE